MPVIEVEHVTKQFRERRGARILVGRGGMGDWLGGKRTGVFTALDDITFTVEEGESLGLIGANGSGKSTLLKLIAGVTVPTRGRVAVHGRVASLLELGAGFHHMLTGRENVYLNAGLLGMRHAQVDDVFDRIVEFSGIGPFIDNPVDTYSSGMYVRIAFAVAAHVDPDIFLIDEVLAVGDEDFQRKCRTRIGELKEQGKTIVFVSHDLGIVNTLCDRVILLSRGKEISRGTPQATIDYYLRQVGQETGIHTIGAGALEAIFCHGRISLFQDQREFTAPLGLQMQFESLGQWHSSATADWKVTVREDARFVAEGRMARLPITLHWEMRIEGERFVWRLAIECHREAYIDMFNANLFWPTLYDRWFYGDTHGVFPEILPQDLHWSITLPPELSCRHVGLFQAERETLPVVIEMRPEFPSLRMQLANADYFSGTRVLQAGARIAQAELPLARGRHDIMTLAIEAPPDYSAFERRIAAIEAARSIRVGATHVRFERGSLVFTHNGRPITSSIHLHTQFLAGQLWDLSHYLVWDTVQRDGDTVRATCQSRRFPLVQEWEFRPAPDGIAFRVTAHATTATELQEYNISLGLIPEYTRWATELEQGAFAEFDPNKEDWSHANENFGPARWISASGDRVPAITLHARDGMTAFRMTACNTGAGERSRVIQAMAVSTPSIRLVVTPDPVVWFDGTIAVVD